MDVYAPLPPRQAASRASPASDQAAVAGYIADMTAQLETMAIAARLDLLAYFLAMARAESETSARAATAEPAALLSEPTPSLRTKRSNPAAPTMQVEEWIAPSLRSSQ
jgi:hypothetical protein